MTYAPGPRAPGSDYAEQRYDAIQALKGAAEAITAAADSGDDAVMLWLGQQVAAGVMMLERDADMAVLVAAAWQDGWERRAEAMTAASAWPPLRAVARRLSLASCPP